MGDTDTQVAGELRDGEVQEREFEDERAPKCSELLMPTFRSVWLTADEEVELSKPFTPHDYNLYNNKGEYTTVKACAITRRLNRVFGLGNVKYISSFDGLHNIEGKSYVAVSGQVLILGEPSLNGLPSIRRAIHYNGFWEVGNLSLTDAFKSAETNARNKALNNELGIGMECWMGLVKVDKPNRYGPPTGVTILDQLPYMPEAGGNDNNNNSRRSRSSSKRSRTDDSSGSRRAESSRQGPETKRRASDTERVSSRAEQSKSSDTAGEMYAAQRQDLIDWVKAGANDSERKKRKLQLKGMFPDGVEKTKELNPEQMNEVHNSWSERYGSEDGDA